jgi:Fur family ferric uptake transcriptional regulator
MLSMVSGRRERDVPGKRLMIPGKKQLHRMTSQRKVILEEIRNCKTHPTADEIYELVRKRIARISLGTVYRNLEILTEQGLIQKLETAGSANRFDWDTAKHYHIRCMNCGRVDNAPVAPLQQLEDELYGATVYTIIGHRLEFVGLCPKCSQDDRLTTALPVPENR